MSFVDTDILIDILRKDIRAKDWFAARTPPPEVCGYVVMELKQGCRNQQELIEVEQLVRPLRAVWPSSETCSLANSLLGPLKLSHSIGMIDILVASTALEHATTLYTFNVKHFVGVPGIDVKSPYIK
jgi:predicted nucleic acid-binding protein